MTFLAVLLALCLEVLLPPRVVHFWRRSVLEWTQELLVDMNQLGFPRLAGIQWLLPVLIWTFGCVLVHRFLSDGFGLAGWLFSVCVLVVALHFHAFSKVLTRLQLFLNQGDQFRARECLLNWMGAEATFHRAPSTGLDWVKLAVEYSAERLFRQFFCVLFWFAVLPGPEGVALYLSVWWSVWRDRRWHETHELSIERPSLAQLREELGWRFVLNSRFVLFALEWLPARLLALSLLPRLNWAEAFEAWRVAGDHTPWSNWARVLALLHHGLNWSPESGFGTTPLAEFRRWASEAALYWLLGLLALSIVGLLPVS